MIETFSIKEEKFINEIYYLTLNVSFNKKNIFDLLETQNIFPSLPVKKDFLFIPVFVDQNKNQVSMFSEDKLFSSWNVNNKKYSLLNYILPTQDLDDFSLIRRNINNLETYDFKEIINKYNINDHIIMIVFKDNNKIRVFNKIFFNQKKNLKNLNYSNVLLKVLHKIQQLLVLEENSFLDFLFLNLRNIFHSERNFFSQKLNL